MMAPKSGKNINIATSQKSSRVLSLAHPPPLSLSLSLALPRSLSHSLEQSELNFFSDPIFNPPPLHQPFPHLLVTSLHTGLSQTKLPGAAQRLEWKGGGGAPRCTALRTSVNSITRKNE